MLNLILIFFSILELVKCQGLPGGSYFDQTGSVYNYDAYGIKLAVNDQYSVLIQNDQQQFILSFAPYGPNGINCTFPYQFPGYEYMYMVAVVRDNGVQNMRFVDIGESFQGGLPFVETVTFDETCSNITFADKQSLLGGNIGDHSDYYVLALDYQGRYAVGFHPEDVYIYDLDTYNLTEYPASQYWSGTGGYAGYGSTYWPYVPHACGLSGDFALVAGYVYDPDSLRYVPVVSLFAVDYVQMTLTMLDTQQLVDNVLLYPYQAANYYLEFGMSVDMNSEKLRALVGVPNYDTVIVVEYNQTNGLSFAKRLITSSGPTKLLAGKSVTWVDNRTAAVLFYALEDDPWSPSEVQVFDIDLALSMSDDSVSYPLYIFPNNQVTVLSTLRFTNFIYITSWSHSLALLTIDGYVVIIPASPPGFYNIPMLTQKIHLFYYYSSIPCTPGLYKSTSGFEPCIVCPPQTYNSGDYANTSCLPCHQDSFCPLGSIEDLNATNLTDVTQATAYPSSPELTIFDDILIQNMFTMHTTLHCLLISPFFWTSVMMIFVLLMLAVIGALHLVPQCHSHRTFIKQLFRRTDLVGEGELWIGGLISCAILVLVSFAYYFSSSYAQLYPIETSPNPTFTCNPSMRNTKFSSGLQLLSTPPSEEEEPLFSLLDEQNFTMTVDFVQTMYDCRQVSMQQNINSYQVPLALNTCERRNASVTLATSIQLPEHLMTIQFSLTGVSSVGGARICLFGPAETSSDSFSTLKPLAFCHLFFTPNQTLAQTAVILLELTRVINRTEAMSGGDPTTFSGLWQPASTVQTLSDQLLYEKTGDYLRYVPTQMNLVIQLTETAFYIKNIQEPIARETEIIFHNILFTIVALELFGLLFLIFKLVFFPLFNVIHQRFAKNQVGVFNEEEYDEQLKKEKEYPPQAFVVEMQKNEPPNVRNDPMMSIPFDRTPFNRVEQLKKN